jgi:hypothetical protein
VFGVYPFADRLAEVQAPLTSVAQRVAPLFPLPQFVQVYEDVALAPALDAKPALKGERGDVVLAGMGDEKARHGNCSPAGNEQEVAGLGRRRL